jgi:hypothetical protein
MNADKYWFLIWQLVLMTFADPTKYRSTLQVAAMTGDLVRSRAILRLC